MYYVQYEVDGFPGTQKAGPYSKDEIESQYIDISGYEGVRCALIIYEENKDDRKEPILS